jgi:hypothetical protein
MKKILVTALILIITGYSLNAQTSWDGMIYFNLIDTSGNIITPNDVINNKVKFYSPSYRAEFVIYDYNNESFAYHSHYITTNRVFYVIYENKVLRIYFPAFSLKALYIKTPVVIDNSAVSYYSYFDFLLNNESEIIFDDRWYIFYVENDKSEKEKIKIEDYEQYLNEGYLIKFQEE